MFTHTMEVKKTIIKDLYNRQEQDLKELLKDIKNSGNARSILSGLREKIREEAARAELKALEEETHRIAECLVAEDAKTRKNAALLLGELECEAQKESLSEAYYKESIRFVKPAYLNALSRLDIPEQLEDWKKELERLLLEEPDAESEKHRDEQIRELRKIISKYEKRNKHVFTSVGNRAKVLLTCSSNLRETVARSLPEGYEAGMHPFGVFVETSDLSPLMTNRLYREMLFLLWEKKLLSSDPLLAAEELGKSNLYEEIQAFHEGSAPFYFRVECKSAMDLEQRSRFVKRFSTALEKQFGGKMVNSVTDYELELRLYESKSGGFFPCLKFYTMKEERFAYRKNAIASSIQPSTAAVIMELSAPYLKENAQIMDPFCGVGTMLIERNIRVPAKEMYATDIYGEATEMGRENAGLAGARIHFIHRDFFDFKHQYPFDEVITNMPVRGKKTKEEMNDFYDDFFQKLPEILAKEAVIILYTNELGFVKKQLRIRSGYKLLSEFCMQKKNEYYLLVIQWNR